MIVQNTSLMTEYMVFRVYIIYTFSILRTLYQLPSMEVVASCSAAVLLPVVLVFYKVDLVIKKEDFLQIL